MRKHQGFSLVELMVAMSLSLILMAGALSILYSSKITYNQNDRLARLQEAGRAALELMTRDARGVGYPGCARPNAGAFFNKLVSPTSLLWNFEQPVYGFQATSTTAWSPGMDAAVVAPLGGSDVLVLRGARQGQSVFRTTMPVAPTAGITVTGDMASSIPQNEPMMISDCEGSTVFAATSYAGGVIAHTTSGTATQAKNVNNSLEQTFQIAAQVIPVQTTIYYVRDAGTVNGIAYGPALYRSLGGEDAELLVDGVQQMQILYGVDTDANLLVDNYVPADAVTNWNNVVSITMALLIRTAEESGTEIDRQTYTLLDAAAVGPFNDRRQRSIFITTVSLRNVGT
ncbi:MAG: PilW family protein [Steroidobacteraceae bacterium]